MMPLFPSPSLKFRTAGFPQYGFKADLSGGAFPDTTRFASALRAIQDLDPVPQLCVWQGVPSRRRHQDSSSYPSGPRSDPGYSVPVHQHLCGHIRPTRRHRPISPPAYTGGLCCASYDAEAANEWFRAFMLDLCRHVAVRDSGKLDGCLYPVPSPSTQLSSIAHGLSVSKTPALRFQQGKCFRSLPTVRLRYNLPTCSPPLSERTESLQPTETFTTGLPESRSLFSLPVIATMATG